MLKSTSVEVDFLFLEEAKVKSLKAATPPNLPLALTSRDYNSHAGKREGLVLHSRKIQFKMQHHYALRVDSEYSPRLLQSDVGKAPNSLQQRKLSLLITTFKCLAKHVEKRGSWRGLQVWKQTSRPSSICHLLAINLSLERNTPKLKLVYTIWSVCYVN
jgi:hypothetical protein